MRGGAAVGGEGGERRHPGERIAPEQIWGYLCLGELWGRSRRGSVMDVRWDPGWCSENFITTEVRVTAVLPLSPLLL